jgi:hypothetical protein
MKTLMKMKRVSLVREVHALGVKITQLQPCVPDGSSDCSLFPGMASRMLNEGKP